MSLPHVRNLTTMKVIITGATEYVGPEEELTFVFRNCHKTRTRKSNQIYIFNPEHDLCIANGDENFVPPRSAMGFARDHIDLSEHLGRPNRQRRQIIPLDTLTSIRKGLTSILADTLVGHYEGFLGVDQMICQSDSPIFIPVSEINLRMTMGLIARNQYDQFQLAESRHRQVIID